MQTMIHENKGEQDMERYARQFTPSIRDDGRRRVLLGETALEELVRVTQEDEERVRKPSKYDASDLRWHRLPPWFPLPLGGGDCVQALSPEPPLNDAHACFSICRPG